MERNTYRKIICNAGHSTRAYAAEEPLPRRCPICGQPYDRRYNRPIFCDKDGTVSEEATEETPKETLEETAGEIIEEIAEDAAEKVEMQPQVTMGRRGRNLAPLSDNFVQSAPIRSGIRGTEGILTDRYNPEQEAAPMRYVQRERIDKQLVLCTGGEKIPISETGGYLGRQEIGGHVFYMNSLISRRHAYVRADRFGNLEVRDAGSLNGTYVDDGKGRRRLKDGETVLLEKGATLWLANQVLVLEEEES